MDPISIALAVASQIPSLLSLFKGDGDVKEKAEKVVSIAASVLGVKPDEVVSKLPTITPEQTLAIIQAGNNLELEMRKQDSADIASVVAAMIAESQSEHWPQWSWRPYNGFLFGTTMFGCYFVLPLMKIPVPSVPFEAWTAWGAVLGVTAWWRGKQKQTITEKGN